MQRKTKQETAGMFRDGRINREGKLSAYFNILMQGDGRTKETSEKTWTL